MSTSTFFTKFFVLLIISRFVVFYAAKENSDGGVVVPRMVPSLTILVPQDNVQNCVGASREEPYFMIFKPLPLPLSRTLSGYLRSFGENPEVWSHAFEFFNHVAGQKRVLKVSIDDDKAYLDRFARNALTENGFIWGGPIGFPSADGNAVRNDYQWLPFVFDMVEFVRYRPDDALQRLRLGIDLAVFERKLGALAEECKVELEKIKNALATLAEAETYIPESPYIPSVPTYDEIA